MRGKPSRLHSRRFSKPQSDLSPISVPDKSKSSGTECQFSVPRSIVLRGRDHPREFRAFLVVFFIAIEM